MLVRPPFAVLNFVRPQFHRCAAGHYLCLWEPESEQKFAGLTIGRIISEKEKKYEIIVRSHEYGHIIRCWRLLQEGASEDEIRSLEPMGNI